jgi:hypothetical protein
LELPLLEPPLSSKCNCVEWEALKEDFDADFRRLRQADLNRMELPRVGDDAVARGDRVGMTATNNVYTSSFHSAKSQYQELLLQKEKAKKRASAGGPIAGGGAAASSLVFEYLAISFSRRFASSGAASKNSTRCCCFPARIASARVSTPIPGRIRPKRRSARS